MIKYNNSNINDWYYGTSDIIKVYRNNAVCYYKIVTSGDTPTQVPCYAVVDDISQYSDTEFVDVYNKADEKWYKLNNLNQYEKYGVYGSGRTITYYEGKLTIEGQNEYIYSGNSWQDVGEVSGSSRLPQGYTEVEYIENTTSAYLNLGINPTNAIGNSFSIETRLLSSWFTGGGTWEYLFSNEQGNASPYYGFGLRWTSGNLEVMKSDETNYTSALTQNSDSTSSFTLSVSSARRSNTTPITLFCGLQGSTVWRNGRGKFYTFKVTVNNTVVRDLVPCKRDSDNMVGMYDIVNDVFYYPPNYTSYQLVAGAATGTTTYPLYYDEKQDPPNNLTFSSMTEAEEYECPWVGMQATIDGVKYIFSGDSHSGYEWVEKPSILPSGYTEVEYIEQTSQNVHTYADSAFTIPLNSVFGDIVSTKISLDSSQNNVSRYIAIFGSQLGLALRQDSGYRYNLNTSYAGKYNYSNSYTMVYDTPLIYKVSPSNIKITNTVTSQEETITFNGTSNTAQTQTSSAIFGLNFTDSGSYMALGKCYWFKLEDSNGNIKYEYIPCIRDNDNKVGMYDIINRQFVYSTYLTLVAGPTV